MIKSLLIIVLSPTAALLAVLGDWGWAVVVGIGGGEYAALDAF